jgi:transposase
VVGSANGAAVSPVVIGMDPHKRSATIEVMDAGETVLGGRYATDVAGYRATLTFAKRFPQRTWAIEGCAGIGKHLALRLIADGEHVVDMPPKLSARMRVFATGQGRKTDATDAHSVALVGTRMTGLRPVINDEQLAVLGLLVDRRRALGEDHTRMISQLHRLLLELIAGGAKKDLSAAQAKALLATVRPRDIAGKTRRRVAAELIADLERIHARKKAANKELNELLKATGTTLTNLHGIGPPVLLVCSSRSLTSRASRAKPTPRPGTAPPRSTPPPGTSSVTACPAKGIVRSTGCCTSWPPSSYATPSKVAPTSTGRRPRARPRWKRCAALNAGSPMSSTASCSLTRCDRARRAREDTRGRHFNPAWPTHTPTSTLRISHFPDPPHPSLKPPSAPRLDTEGCQEREKRQIRPYTSAGGQKAST